MAARSSAARKLKRELDNQLQSVAAATNRQLAWSPTESALIEQVLDALDRKSALQADWAAADNADARLRIAAEIRLIEAHTERVLRRIVIEAPAAPPASRGNTSRKAQAAANSRWNRQRLEDRHAN
jgi:hypothetical protein